MQTENTLESGEVSTSRKTHTKPLRAKDYISDAGQLSLSRLVDDALEALAGIRWNGVGKQRSRSRGVILRSFQAIAVQAGYSEREAFNLWRDQVRPLDELAANAEE